MVTFVDLTHVSGLTISAVASIIAFSVFLIKLLTPHAVVFILGGILGDQNTTATWTVAGRMLQDNHWPWILGSDNGLSRNVAMGPRIISWLLPITSIIIAVAGVITPLGLYEGLWTSTPTVVPFKYAPDASFFGQGTPARSPLGFNRRCGSPILKPCPFTSTVIKYKSDSDSTSGEWDGTYDTNVPQILLDAYASGTKSNSTVSNMFDIQYRQWATRNDLQTNNGTAFLVGSLRQVQTMTLRNRTEAIEGLVVDTVNGSVGFRNHTIPSVIQQSARWTEDLLFAQPETACVPLNLTLDFSVTTNSSVKNLALTDRGGFSNIDKKYPEWDQGDPQANPDLWGRAYKAAWLTNVYGMLYWNITNPRDEQSKYDKPFQYLNSRVGKRYELDSNNKSSTLNSISITSDWGSIVGFGTGGWSLSGSSSDSLNPYNLTKSNYTSVTTLCHGAGGGDFANLTNIFVQCGLVFGAAQRTDPGSPLILEEGSAWTIPVYSCATATKASVKTVSFNQSTAGLDGLAVTDIQDKKYANPDDRPLWAVENTGFNLSEIYPLWGLVSPEAGGRVNMSAVRSERFYLPGYAAAGAVSNVGSLTLDNMPGARFHVEAAATTYSVSPATAGVRGTDYTGFTNLALWARWQALSATATGAASMVNLIWTDNAASMVVGTKGSLGPGNAGPDPVPLTVQPVVARVSYRWPYAIPAAMACLLFLVACLAAGLAAVTGRAGVAALRRHIHQTSAGRIFAACLDPDAGAGAGGTRGAEAPVGGFSAPGREWARAHGARWVDLRGAPALTSVADALPPHVYGASGNKPAWGSDTGIPLRATDSSTTLNKESAAGRAW